MPGDNPSWALTYFADLSPFVYPPIQAERDPLVLSVGWLAGNVHFSEGAVDAAILEKLLRLSQHPLHRTRGWHRCEFCDRYPAIMELARERIHLGDAVIQVPGRGGVLFVAPTLICHYISAHGYRPPDSFLHAPRDAEDESRLSKL